MSLFPKIQVLREFRPFARSLTVFNSENFSQGSDVHAIRRNILRAAGCTALFSALVGLSSVNCWSCLALELDWNERAYHFVLLLCILQQLFTFASMAMKSRQFINTLEKLQKIVDDRKSFQFSGCWLALLVSSCYSSISFAMHRIPMHWRNQPIARSLWSNRAAVCRVFQQSQ